MISDKYNIISLVNVLKAHGVTDAVVCPGSRNAAIVRSMHGSGLRCHAVVDERSAAFYAIGIYLATGRPVAVCVTSGSAVCNLSPAVAEAYYRHVPLILVTADRPAARIDQLDGQTMPQPGVYGQMCRMSVTVDDGNDAPSRAYCDRQINAAMIAALTEPYAPVQIDMQLSEPLFGLGDASGVATRIIKVIDNKNQPDQGVIDQIISALSESARPMLVVGQMGRSERFSEAVTKLSQLIPAMFEPLSNVFGGENFDEALSVYADNAAYQPDTVIYCGDTVVSKRLKRFLRYADRMIMISADGEIHDVADNVTTVVRSPQMPTIEALSKALSKNELEESALDFGRRWRKALDQCARISRSYEPLYSQMLAVKAFEAAVGEAPVSVHYANSSAVRLANIYARHYVWVNRGVNGIEGSLSCACGYSLADAGVNVCVIGDLSFFYDNNALWVDELRGNLRIILLNNGGGGIFRGVSGMPVDDVNERYVMGRHRADARGICMAYDIDYIRVDDASGLDGAIARILDENSGRRPLLCEVVTDADTDTAQLKRYYEEIRKTLI